MALTEVRHTLVDARKLPRTGVLVTARLWSGNGYIVGTNQEIVEKVTEPTDDAGLVKLFLTPQAEIEYVGSTYQITWAGQDKPRYVSVPLTGPVNLRNILASPPDLGGGAGGTIAGRGITSTAVVAGNLVVTYTDGTTQSAGQVNPGTTPGPSAYQVAVANGFVGTEAQWLASLQGPAGTGSTTVTNLTTIPVPVIAYKNNVGATLFKAGRLIHNLVDRYGADPTNTADSSQALLDMATELNALPNTTGAVGEIPAGNYLINTATRILIDGEGLGIRGAVQNGSRLNFTHPDGGMTVGSKTELRQGGYVRDLTLDGGQVAKNLLNIGWVGGREFSNLRMFGGGFNTADTQAVRDRSACLIVESAQNCLFFNVQAKQSRGHGVIFDHGTGGHLFNVLQINEINLADQADLYHLWVRSTALADYPSLYNNIPQNMKIKQGFMEGLGQVQDYIIRLDAGDSIDLEVQSSSSSRYPKPITFLHVGATCTKISSTNQLFRGNNAGAGSTKIATGVHVAAGAKYTRLDAPEFANCGTGVFLEAAAEAVIDGQPVWVSSDKLVAGPGARGLIKNFTIRAGSVSGLPSLAPRADGSEPGVDYLGVRALITAGGTGTYDTTLTCLRRGGVYQWVEEITGGSGPTLLTHVAGASVVVDASLNEQFEITAVGNMTLASTTNNSPGRLTLLTIRPGATARTISFVTAGTGGFLFTSAVPGPTLTIPANKTAEVGWKYDSTAARNRLLAFSVDQ